MTTYMKGTIFLTKDVSHRDYKIATGRLNDETNYRSIIRESREYRSLSDKQRQHIFNFLGDISTRSDYKDTIIEDSKVIEFFRSILEKNDVPYSRYGYRFDLIYEPFKSFDGRSYAKELITGLIFPVINISEFDVSYKLCLLNDTNYYSEREFALESSYALSIDDLDKCGSFICNTSVADINEVEEYLHRYDKGFGRNRKKQTHIDTVTTLFKKNVFNREIKQTTQKKETQNDITLLMENIEFLLRKLKTINPSSYKDLESEYNEILSENTNTKTEIDIDKLKELESRIKLSLVFQNQNINEYLETTRIEYIRSFTSKSKSPNISLDDLDRITELFLKTKNNYSIIEQRKILRNIASLYFFEVKESISVISKERLERSYFVDNIKSILICIESLNELGFININLNIYDDLTLDNLLEIIRSIEFVELSEEDCMKLILKY